jgi:hypothetical protein
VSNINAFAKFRAALIEGKLQQRGFKDANEIKELINIVVENANALLNPPTIPSTPTQPNAPPSPRASVNLTAPEAVKEATLALAELNHLLRRPQKNTLMWTRAVVLQIIRDLVLKSNFFEGGIVIPEIVTPGGRGGGGPGVIAPPAATSASARNRGKHVEKEEEQPIYLTTLFNLACEGKFIPYQPLSKEDVVDMGQVIGRGGAGKVRRAKVKNFFSTQLQIDVPFHNADELGGTPPSSEAEVVVALKEFDPDIMIMDANLRQETFREVAVMS